MSREKQIKEMARDLENHTCMSQFQAEITSRMLYNAGYRKQEWISVEERLPELQQDVFVCDEIGDVFTDRLERDGKWNNEISRRWGIKYLYWMPLPEPPKGGAE